MRQITTALTALGLVIAASAPAYADKYSVKAQATAGQQARMDRGVRAVQSAQESSLIRFMASNEPFEEESAFQVLVVNGGDEPFDFGTEHLSATLADGTPIRILSYEEVAKKEKKGGGFWKTLSGLVGSGINAAAASYSSEFATFAKAKKAGDSLLGQSGAERPERTVNLTELLSTTTVDPGDSFGGTVIFELPKKAQKAVNKNKKKPTEMLVKVSAGREEHVFTVLVERAK
ncbi:hypothetical protein [Pedomonas sp. V897]|uniref:hypothetical protein n=1 Tax=Pedomonas sp. V897 TaxID=3446482 RepID=UPI003EE1D904